MQLSKLRLVGFKSFVEATDFQIEPGLTGIIGPNGCGKSNLVEALRWVMGENSYKSMRGSGMDDVIFAGAADRPARNMAEVGLVLDNSSRTAPAAFNDADQLEVTRRIEREQGSTYRINGREVRARDVQILFADASTGARSPALVRQGQISEIISSKPQARRRILEEAAGVAGLHTRRHEAELRLKAAEDNLVRIGDLLGQIDSQADGLRRQARHASRYRELQGEIRRTHALVILIEYEDARREVAAAQAALGTASSEVVDRTRMQAEAARQQAVAAHALPELRDKEGDASTALQRVVVAREALDGEERRAKGRLAELERRIREMESDLSRDAAALEDGSGALGRLDAEEAELGAGGDTEGAEAAVRSRLAQIEGLRAAAEADLDRLQTMRSEIDARRQALDERLRAETTRLARFEREHQQAQQARIDLQQNLQLGEALELATRALQRATEAAATAEAKARKAEQDVAHCREQEQAARSPLVEADRKAQRLETEVRTLAKLLETQNGAKFQPIVDSIGVEKGYEAALGAALGDDLEASGDIRAPSHWAGSTTPTNQSLPDGTTPLSKYVRAPAALDPRLAQIGLVERTRGHALRQQLCPGQRLVSKEGDIWRWDGFTQAAEAPTPAARRLTERNRLADLRLDTEAAQAAYADLKKRAEAIQERLRTGTAAEADTRNEWQAARRTLDAARSEHGAIERRQNEGRAKLAAVDAAEETARCAREEAAATIADIEAQCEALAPTTELETQIAARRGELAGHRADETEARALLQSVAREREARVRRLSAIAAERASWKSRQEQTVAHCSDVDARLSEARIEHRQLADSPDRFVLARRRILGEVEAAEAKLRNASDRRVAGESALADADRAAREALEGMAEARENKVRSEARGEAAQTRLEGVVRTASTELECGPQSLPAIAGVQVDQSRPPSAQVGAKLESLRTDRERLGAVNLRAEDELRAIEEQRSGLDKERTDLTEAIRRLRQAIGTLNKEGRERLLAAFDTVNGHFRDLFVSLFGGGTAELQLIESDDPLDAGLEIMARPPGKKPQVMTLLSGGEQALTAISLIFAVFLTNPSPICVLDEVDAPLDDANVERFCDLVDEMRKKTDTRFIAITHNPITMARMDRLFGVTQAEQGISQLVSVDLAEAEQLLEAS